MSVRFCIRDADGRRSAMWSLFVMGSNVGLTTTEAGGSMKVNLHESGSWQIGYTSEYEKRHREKGLWQRASRHWQIWRRPSTAVPGFTAAIKILVPSFALQLRPGPQKQKRVRWVEARKDRAVSFTIWLSRLTVPPWGYGPDSDVLATIPLPNGEYVLIGAHYVDSNDATTVMLTGLSGFVQMLMERDTTKMEPLPMESTLLSFSEEPSGVRTITEIALWGLTTADVAPNCISGKEPVHQHALNDLSRGLMDVEVRIPKSVFSDQGVDPDLDPKSAQRIVKEWNETKVVEMRRLLRLPTST